MAVGEVVNGIGAVATQINFQPAANVELCITQCGAEDAWTRLTNGTLNPIVSFTIPANGSNYGNKNGVQKIMINNTNYLRIDASGSYSGFYTGIQIK